MLAQYEGPASSALLDARKELRDCSDAIAVWSTGDFTFSVFVRERHVWLLIESDAEPLALRAVAVATGTIDVSYAEPAEHGFFLEAGTDIGAFRLTIRTSLHDRMTVVHSRTRLVPSHDLRLTFLPRDLFALETQGASPQSSGRLIAKQHGFQTGSLFAIGAGSPGSSIFYLQNFSALRDYFADTRTTPKDCVGGNWPEIGFLLPMSEEHPLLASNEYTVSDTYLVLRANAPETDGDIARHYLDALAQVVRLLDPPARTFHHWPHRAQATIVDLSHSPECTLRIDGRRYLAPYVDTKNKPPESMVQLTVLVALLEYERWSGTRFSLTHELIAGLPAFFNEEIGTVVRWLPRARFGEREDEHQTHEAMDSWYLYHVLFNLSRLAASGHAQARRLLERSLPYAIRVARRFAYRWPIFFNLETLDIIQAEASKGSGGENDVSGLYALVMLHAHELFGDQTYLDEAQKAAAAMEGFGFGLSYQTNTTLFAAEAAMRLWRLTQQQRYFDLALVALANVFDNMSIWQCAYGNAHAYSTYFGLYPLRGAPYIAAYEEVEALGKFHQLAEFCDDGLPPSVTLLLSEYAKWLLSRGWQYYPSELPEHVLAAKTRNGKVRRELSIPLEDLQDGMEASGQVGQEIYGAGLALVCATRHFRPIAGRDYFLFCEYPADRSRQERVPHRRRSSDAVRSAVGSARRGLGDRRGRHRDQRFEATGAVSIGRGSPGLYGSGRRHRDRQAGAAPRPDGAVMTGANSTRRLNVSSSHQRLGVVLAPDGSPLEIEGVLNPGVTRDRDGVVLMYPRMVAAGNVSRIGLVRCREDGDALVCERLGIALEPGTPYETRSTPGWYGCEDPRVTFVPSLDRYVMLYTAFGAAGARIAVAVSADGYDWTRLGLLRFAERALNDRDNKDAAIFPEPVISPRGVSSYAIYHRPMLPDSINGQTPIPIVLSLPPEQRESTALAYVPADGVHKNIENLCIAQESVPVLGVSGSWGLLKNGAGTPPVKTSEGWLSLFHGVDAVERDGEPRLYYRAGIVVHDLREPHRIRYRSPEPVLGPVTSAERFGTVDDVVFPTGILPRNQDTYDVFYGAADARIARARFQIALSREDDASIRE